MEAIRREILQSFWKIHVVHHAAEGPVYGQWMLKALAEHGCRVGREALRRTVTQPVGRSSTSIPSLSSITRRPYAATLSSCVTWTMVVPAMFTSDSNSMISRA